MHLLKCLQCVLEPTTSAVEKDDQDAQAEVSKLETKKRQRKIYPEATRKSSRHKA
jgi:hypothetical protein